MVKEYSGRAPGFNTPSPTTDPYIIAERVAEGSGRSNIWMSRLSKTGKVLGPIAFAVGLYFAIKDIINAPEGQRLKVALGELGSFAGGAIGFSYGMEAGVALAGGVATFMAALGIVSNPVGWAIGLGLLFGLAGAWAFGDLGREYGKTLDQADGFYNECYEHTYDPILCSNL